MSKSLVLKLSVSINAPTPKVWDALTNPAQIKKYLFGTETTSQWKKGSPISFRGTWEGKPYEDKGTILQFEPEKVLAYSYWSKFSKLPDLIENYSVMEFRLTLQESQTILTLTHSNLFAEGMIGHSNFYWNITLNRIKELIEKS